MSPQLGVDKTEPLWSVTLLGTLKIPTMGLREIILGIKDHTTWSSINKIIHTKGVINTATCRTTSTVSFANRILCDRLNERQAEQAQNTNHGPKRSSTVQKYVASVKENITYPELTMKIHRHIQVEKTYDLEAKKPS